MTQCDSILLVDATMYVFRAYYSLPDDFQDADGNLTNAVYGFAGFLVGLLEERRPRRIALAFDESLASSFRNEIYPEYKANRDPAPEDLKRQLNRCKDVAHALGVTWLSDDRYEADDLIGTLAHQAHQAGDPVMIVSGDKDLLQLLEPGDTFWNFGKHEPRNAEQMTESFGMEPARIVDYLALTGDSVDNIPGVTGIGPKTAQALLAHFDDLDDIYQRVDEVEFLRIRGAKSVCAKLKDQRDQAFVSRQLATIETDVPQLRNAPDLRWIAPRMDKVEALFDELNFGPMLRRRCRELQLPA